MDFEHNESNFLTWVIVIVAGIVFLKISDYNVTCRSHDTFMFLCHHNDTNTDIYLRRISEKLDKIFEQLDKRPLGSKTYDDIEHDTYKARRIMSCSLEQLALLKNKKIQTNLFSNLIIPTFLLHEDSRSFDRYNDVIVRSVTEYYHYTAEQADILRKSLPERMNKSEVIKYILLCQIESELQDVIRYEIMQMIIEKYEALGHFGIKPDNLGTLIYSGMQSAKRRKHVLFEAIKSGVITNIDELCEHIRKIFGSSISNIL